MKRNLLIISLFCLTAAFFASCKPEAQTFSVADLFGKWESPTISKANPSAKQYCVFLSEKDDSGEYYWGKTWDEGEDVTEADVDKEKHGNGWMKWKLVEASLTEIHMMSVSQAGVPKIYTVTLLNASKLEYKDDFGKTYSWTKK